MSTKNLRKSTRRLIRDYDQFQQVYPPLIRSSDPLNNGISTQISFNDNKVLVFSDQNVLFPSMTPSGSSNLPNSTISATIDLRAAAVEQRPSLPGSAESLTPFNETEFNLPATYENTASIALAPGFSIPARNKIAIPIDITANQEKFMFRLGFALTNADPDGLFYGQASTGFCYYNFDLKKWEDIGLDPNFYTGHMGDASVADPTTVNGQNYFMSQFVGTPNTTPNGSFPAAVSTALLPNYIKFFGYDKIGSPTEFFDAPFAPRYHATGSQGLPMSNYIAQPFALERIDVKIPFVARRKHGPIITGARAESSLRDIDNLVFFIYRQSGNVDSKESTVRSLIAHESLSFFNSKINSNVDYKTHNPVFSYDYDVSLSSTAEQLVTGSVTFTTRPKITSKNFAGTTGLSFFDTGVGRYKRAGIMNFWSGPMESAASSSLNTVDGEVGGASGNNDFWRIKNSTRDDTAGINIAFDSELDPDSRFITNYATGSLQPLASYLIPTTFYSSKNWSQYNTPYILLPQDRLIFGLESDICTRSTENGLYAAGVDSSPLGVTSSFFKILTDQAQVTLYGSLIQDGVAKTTNSINQNLTSPAVHEIIANTQDDTDQFDISERSLFVGTYLDNFITGSMTSNTRAIAQSIIDGPQISSGSFIRSLQLSDVEKTYWQLGEFKFFFFTFPYFDAKSPKNYFRYNKYGNFRDMLEQARDYRIFNKTLYKKNGGFEEQGPVYAQFVLSSSDVPVSASLTQCNNLSPYMTATFPFDDGYNGSTSRGPYTTTQNNPFIPITNIFKT